MCKSHDGAFGQLHRRIEEQYYTCPTNCCIFPWLLRERNLLTAFLPVSANVSWRESRTEGQKHVSNKGSRNGGRPANARRLLAHASAGQTRNVQVSYRVHLCFPVLAHTQNVPNLCTNEPLWRWTVNILKRLKTAPS